MTAAGVRPQAIVTTVHARVPGRIRYSVRGLYRAPVVRRRLIQHLSALSGVRRVSASVLTGKLLVVFCPGALDGRRIAREVAMALGAHGFEVGAGTLSMPFASPAPAAPRAGGRETKSWPGGSDARRLLARTLLAHGVPATAFGGAAGASGSQACRGPAGQPVRPWHTMDPADVLERLGSSETTGLRSQEATARLRLHGENRLEGTKGRSEIGMLLGQLNSLPVGLLGVSAAVSVATGGLLDAAVISGVVVINSAIGFLTERQAERTIRSLADSDREPVSLLRDGQRNSVPVERLVPGDVLLLSPGTYVGADLRLLSSHRLSVDESALTGESLPALKDAVFVADETTSLRDRANMTYMGTHVTGGNGSGVVVATASASELGQIQAMVGSAESPETPMQRQLHRMGTALALVSGAVCAGVFSVGVLRGFGWLEMLKSSVSLAVAAVPEGLPAVATTILAMGIRDMRARNVAVRHLDAVESLGSVHVLCLDKTGTLTMNRMAVVSMYAGDERFSVDRGSLRHEGSPVEAKDNDELLRLIQVVTLCSEASVELSSGAVEIDGSATERALVEMAVAAGVDVDDLRGQYPTLRTRYRADGRPFMSTLHARGDGSALLAVKGAPEQVLDRCGYELRDGMQVRLDPEARRRIRLANESMAGDALRVLGVAFRHLDSGRMPARTGGLVWLGLAGLADPMRPGMDELMALYHRAGVKTVMITGDQSVTAQAIGRQLGLSNGGPLRVLEASAIDTLDDALLAGIAKDVHVFARVSPAHKLKIVRALQGSGHVVAMTGDGINDGPALKAAEIGIAMGSAGTDFARSVSDVVVEDDNLHTMAVAMRQGRAIFDNIRKTIHFMVSTNLTEIEIMLASVALGMGQPLNPMQLLWVNLITDIFPGLALSLEPPEPGIMERPPRDPNEAIVRGDDLRRMIFESATIAAGTMAAFVYGRRRYGAGTARASTLAFTALAVNELVHAHSSRSRFRRRFRRTPGTGSLAPNRHLSRAVAGMLAAQALAVWLPPLRRLLGTSPLGALDLAVVCAGALLPLIANESTKPRPQGTGAESAGSRSPARSRGRSPGRRARPTRPRRGPNGSRGGRQHE